MSLLGTGNSPGNGGDVLLTHKTTSNQQSTFKFSSPKLWSPDSPNLYNISIKMGDDEVRSYTAFRTIETGTVKGIKRPLLNGKFVFLFGTLDQGYWPDGIYTPPTLEAMVYDLQVLKSIGMNMVRKHVSHNIPRFTAPRERPHNPVNIAYDAELKNHDRSKSSPISSTRPATG